MEIKNQNFQNSLRCLQHPATILSIALLLLNDHVFKVVSPSWLTGKLSDFAGLFFFPFIVAAGLSLVLANLNLTPRFIGLVSFGIVAIWFTLLKTFSFANSLTAQFASLFIGLPVLFILDMTDLIALIAIIPAWKLWKHAPETKPTKFAYVALCIGAFAAIATSPRERTIYSVTDLNYSEDDVLYAADKDEYSEEWFPVAISRDGGLTWELSHDTNGNMQNIDQKAYPVDYCKYIDYYQVTHCYRVTKTQQFQYAFKYSRDKKESYSWSPVFPPKGMTIKAYDLIVFPCESHQCILVAIGEAGVLRRVFPDGNWEFIEVLGAGSHEIFSNNP